MADETSPGFLRRRWRTLAALGVPIVALIALAAGRRPAVDAAEVRRQEVVQTVVATGRVEPAARIQIGTTLLGTVRTVNCCEWQEVKAGDLLAELDHGELAAALHGAEAQVSQARLRVDYLRRIGAPSASEDLRQAQVALDNAQEEYTRGQALFETTVITRAELDELDTALELARSRFRRAELQALNVGTGGSEYGQALAALVAAEATRDAAADRVEQAHIRAPADGVVLRRFVEVGDIVQPGKVLMEMARAGDPMIEVAVDEKSLPGLEPGKIALVAADAFPAERFEAEVAAVAPSVDAARGTVEIKLRVAEPPAFLRTDMTVTVELEVDRHPDALVVPTGALQGADGAEPHVLVLDGRRAAERQVRPGLRGDGFIEILEGVDEGETVLIPGVRDVEPGDRVRPHRLAATDS